MAAGPGVYAAYVNAKRVVRSPKEERNDLPLRPMSVTDRSISSDPNTFKSFSNTKGIHMIFRYAKRTMGVAALLTGIAGTLGSSADVAYGQSASTVTIQTVNGHFLTAVNGGGIGGPNTGPGAAALHTDAKYPNPGPWETLTCVALGPNQLAFQTATGQYVTAVNGGGMGGPNANPYEVHTDAKTAGQWEQFKLVWLSGGKCALQNVRRALGHSGERRRLRRGCQPASDSHGREVDRTLGNIRDSILTSADQVRRNPSTP
jgi:hypothetical protein